MNNNWFLIKSWLANDNYRLYSLIILYQEPLNAKCFRMDVSKLIVTLNFTLNPHKCFIVEEFDSSLLILDFQAIHKLFSMVHSETSNFHKIASNENLVKSQKLGQLS